MKYTSYIKTALIAAIGITALNSCVKSDDYSVPPIACNDKFTATNHSLSDLVAIGKVKPLQSDIITSDYIVEAYVSSSDQSGNIYKAMYIQDKPQNPTIGVEVDIDGSNQYVNYPVGAKVRINLKGLIVQAQNGNIKIGSYDPAYAVGRINPNNIGNYIARVCGTDGKAVIAKMVPVEFNSISEALKDGARINQLVKVNNVQFEDAELTKTFADATATGDRYITDKRSNRLDLRFSNYASFSTVPISPTYAGSGSITLIVSRYSTTSSFTDQAYIRDLTDISFSGPRFTAGVPDAPSAAAVNLFAGSDFENWSSFISNLNSYGLISYASQGVGQGFNNSNSLQIKGNAGGNDYVFTALSTGSAIPANPKRITMYIKGTATGKSLSFNLYKADGTFYPFNLGTFTTGALLDPAAANSYTGSINTNGDWKLIELTLTGITDINTAATKPIFAIKTGSAGAYNLQIDNIKIE